MLLGLLYIFYSFIYKSVARCFYGVGYQIIVCTKQQQRKYHLSRKGEILINKKVKIAPTTFSHIIFFKKSELNSFVVICKTILLDDSIHA